MTQDTYSLRFSHGFCHSEGATLPAVTAILGDIFTVLNHHNAMCGPITFLLRIQPEFLCANRPSQEELGYNVNS